jgi:LmbE family N-acetylglucosaminyl deacetylase
MKARRIAPCMRRLNPFSRKMPALAVAIVLIALLAVPVRASPLLPAPARLLVVAPHPDDEVLGAGGLIYSVSQHGGEVKVVFMTMGDGYSAAAGMLFAKGRPSADDYLALGEHRRQEAISALAALGLDERNIVFLGYPDRGLANIIDDWHWSPTEAYTSPHTGCSKSPYSSTFAPNASYCISQIVSDLASILTYYMPDLILLPHPSDTHDDHHATYALSSFAIQHLNYVELTGAKVLCYIVHSGPRWPAPWAYQPNQPLDPPPWHEEPAIIWHRVELSHEAKDAKLQALRKYSSQLLLMPSFLKSFIRTNELLAQVPMTDLSTDHDGAQALEHDGGEAGPTLQHLRLFQPSGEITSVVASREDEGVSITATLAWRPSSSITYRLNIFGVNPSSNSEPVVDLFTYDITPAGGQFEQREVSFVVPQDDLEHIGAKALFEVVTLRRNRVIDRSGWILLFL